MSTEFELENWINDKKVPAQDTVINPLDVLKEPNNDNNKG